MKPFQLSLLPLLLLALPACQGLSGGTEVAVAEAMAMQPPTPQKEHLELQETVGEWEGQVTLFLPDGSEEVSPASEVVRANGPFWVSSEFQMDMGPMGTYMGFGRSGYDAAKGCYVGTWTDSMGSTLSVMEGGMQGGALVMHWRGPNEMGQVVPQKSVTQRSADAYTMTFYADGVKGMMISMKRKTAGM